MGDYQTILNWVLGVAMGVSGWFARQMWDAVKELKKDLSSLREELAKDYVPKAEFFPFAAEIRQMFQHISEKLDKKADK